MDERPDAMSSPIVDGVAVLTEAFGAHNAEERGIVSSEEEELDDLERSLNNEDISEDEFSSNGTNIKKRKRDGDDSVDGLTPFAKRPEPWTKDEITRLVTLTNCEPKKSYDEIKTHFPTRTRVAIANKVKALRAATNRKSPGSSQSSQQSVLHSKWTAEEVRLLSDSVLRCTDASGEVRWNLIEPYFPNRSSKAIRTKWREIERKREPASYDNGKDQSSVDESSVSSYYPGNNSSYTLSSSQDPPVTRDRHRSQFEEPVDYKRISAYASTPPSSNVAYVVSTPPARVGSVAAPIQIPSSPPRHASPASAHSTLSAPPILIPDDDTPRFATGDVKGWLASIGLVEYASKFADAGWDDLAIIKQAFSKPGSRELLNETGVTKIGHVTKICLTAPHIRLAD